MSLSKNVQPFRILSLVHLRKEKQIEQETHTKSI